MPVFDSSFIFHHVAHIHANAFDDFTTKPVTGFPSNPIVKPNPFLPPKEIPGSKLPPSHYNDDSEKNGPIIPKNPGAARQENRQEAPNGSSSTTQQTTNYHDSHGNLNKSLAAPAKSTPGKPAPGKSTPGSSAPSKK